MPKHVQTCPNMDCREGPTALRVQSAPVPCQPTPCLQADTITCMHAHQRGCLLPLPCSTVVAFAAIGLGRLQQAVTQGFNLHEAGRSICADLGGHADDDGCYLSHLLCRWTLHALPERGFQTPVCPWWKVRWRQAQRWPVRWRQDQRWAGNPVRGHRARDQLTWVRFQPRGGVLEHLVSRSASNPRFNKSHSVKMAARQWLKHRTL